MTLYIEFDNKKLYLYRSGNIFYFKPTKERRALDELPEGYKIIYGKNGFPMVKRIK